MKCLAMKINATCTTSSVPTPSKGVVLADPEAPVDFSSMEDALRTFMGAFGGGGAPGGDSIFDSFFGGGFGGGPQGGPIRGASKKATLTISFDDSVKGVEKEISISSYANCDACDGTGAKNPSDLKVCSTCGGHGQVPTNAAVFSP